MPKPKEFYVQETLVTEGQKVVRKLSVQEDDKGLASDAYHHGEEYWHVIEKSYADGLETRIKDLKAAMLDAVKRLEGLSNHAVVISAVGTLTTARAKDDAIT